MPVDAQTLKKKAKGAIDALKTMSPKEREASPDVALVDDFNRLQRLALEARPELAGVFPTEVETFPGFGGEMVHNARYAELLAYYSQIYELL